MPELGTAWCAPGAGATQPLRIVDLFCGAGGASMGLSRVFPQALIVGVDIVPQKRYPFCFVQADARTFPLKAFDIIWASPPCQAHSKLRALSKKDYPDFIQETRHRLKACSALGKPTVIENVVGAPLHDPIILCGSVFGLGVWRHRLFECSFPVRQPLCDHASVPLPIDVTGTGGPCKKRTSPGGGIHRKPTNMAEARRVMGINWMTRKEITQAVPPAYAQYIGADCARILSERFRVGEN